MSDKNINNLSYIQKCEILNQNPVFVARHFQYWLEVFFTKILMGTDLLGEIKYYIIRIEF